LSHLVPKSVGSENEGNIFPLSWLELLASDLDSKLESYWQDLTLPIGHRRAKALWLTIPDLRTAAGLPSTIESPQGLAILASAYTSGFAGVIEEQGWDEEDLWLMNRKRRRTIPTSDVG